MQPPSSMAALPALMHCPSSAMSRPRPMAPSPLKPIPETRWACSTSYRTRRRRWPIPGYPPPAWPCFGAGNAPFRASRTGMWSPSAPLPARRPASPFRATPPPPLPSAKRWSLPSRRSASRWSSPTRSAPTTARPFSSAKSCTRRAPPSAIFRMESLCSALPSRWANTSPA